MHLAHRMVLPPYVVCPSVRNVDVPYFATDTQRSLRHYRVIVKMNYRQK